MLTGCASYLVPLRGQTEAQTKQDYRECGAIAGQEHKAGVIAQSLLLPLGSNMAEQARVENYQKVKADCIAERGYRMKTPEDYK